MTNRGRLVVDAAVAIFVAALVLIFTAGLGVVAIMVGMVVVISAISFGVNALVCRLRGQPVRHRARSARRR